MAILTKMISKKTLFTFAAIVILLLNLLFLFYFKYSIQSFPFKNFDLSYKGNILDLIFTVIIIAGLIVYLFQPGNKMKINSILAYALILCVILILGAVSSQIENNFKEIYIFDQPIGKAITGLIFFLYQLIQFIYLYIIWLSILSRNSKLIFYTPVFAVFTLILFYVFTFIFISFNKQDKINNEEGRASDVAVVLGAAVWSDNRPSPSLYSRVAKAAELYKAGKISKIQLTGAKAPGELSESEVALRELEFMNIDRKDILLESGTSSTAEQIHFIKYYVIGKKNFKNILIISDAYHLARIRQICEFYNVKAEVISSDLSLSFESLLYYKIRESVAVLAFWLFGL
jgi:vancomycin permeability regulator SanA